MLKAQNQDNLSSKRVILIAYKFMPQYRVDFFNKLKEQLIHHNIDLILVYGNSVNNNRQDEKVINWGIYRKNKIFRICGLNLIWQPISDLIPRCDLVIVEQANSLLINYLLIFNRFFFRKKLGFWGHGRNRQSASNTFSNWFKKKFIKNCDHWFAYTESVRLYLNELKYPDNKITVLNNTFDTEKNHKFLLSISEIEKNTILKSLNFDKDDDIVIFCGALYKEKRIDFLLKAAEITYSRNNKFKLIVVGSGDETNLINNFCKGKDWIRYVGPKFDRDKALYFSVSKLSLMPGAVGLAVLDSFSLNVPMVICSIETHGPEVDYLIDNVNSIFTPDDPKLYSDALLMILNDNEKLNKLKQACINCYPEYTLDKMVSHFINGVKISLYD